MRKTFITSVCALCLLVGATSALAGAYGEPIDPEETPAAAAVAAAPEGPDYAIVAPYIGAGGLYAIELFENDGDDADNSGGPLVRIGFRAHRHVAIEALFEDYNKFDTSPGYLSAWSVSANVKGYLLTGRWQPYALMGVGYLDHDKSKGNPPGVAKISGDGSFMMRFGGGLDAYINEHWSVGPELAYILPIEGSGAGDMRFLTISLGVNYKFLP